jgi:hypothetical protein
VLVWIVALLGSIVLRGGEAESVEGTWKVREPLRLEVAGDICEVRRGVAHLKQTGSTLSGTYDSEFACWSPYAPQVEWSPRHGELLGRIEDSVLSFSSGGALLRRSRPRTQARAPTASRS